MQTVFYPANAGHHLTFFMPVAGIVAKIEGFSHTDLNHPALKARPGPRARAGPGAAPCRRVHVRRAARRALSHVRGAPARGMCTRALAHN